LPSYDAFWKWYGDHPDFAEKIDRSKAARARAMAEKTIDIADNAVDPQKAKVQSENRKWLASKYNRQEFGDKLDVQHTHVLDITEDLAQANARLRTVQPGCTDLEGDQVVDSIEQKDDTAPDLLSDDLTDYEAQPIDSAHDTKDE
jgi:hypothetical protein